MVATKYGANKYIKTGHQVVGATWQENDAQWLVKVKNLESGEEFDDTCDFLVMASGILNDWQWPNIPGLKDFQGKLIHSADWDQDFDATGKDIALIGGGSSGIQILPALQPIAKHIDHYHHSKMWIAAGGFAAEEAFKRNPEGGNCELGDMPRTLPEADLG
jgi:cation diffusion facilitator CzcD-associated flavoprotein CzcO